MKISDRHRTIIVEEIEYVVKNMAQSELSTQKLYYFSAVYGVVQRIYNIEYDDDLVYLHFILKSTYDSIHQRYEAIKQSGDINVQLHQSQFESLENFTRELGEKIKAKKSFSSILKKFVLLINSTSGNGYYLMQKGLLKL